MRFRAIALWFVAFAASLSAAPPVPLDESLPVPGGGPMQTHLEYRMLIRGDFLATGGFSLAYVDPHGPGAWMFTSNNQRAILEAGDIVVAVNNLRLKTPADYYTELNKAGVQKGVVRLTVRDVRTGKEFTYTAHPALVQIIGPAPVKPPGGRATAVKILLIGLTDDPSIGPAITVSIERMKSLFTQIPGYDKNHLRVLIGKEVTAPNILKAVDDTRVGPTETLFVYYLGHGAYDPNKAANDPSFGHHFQIPGGDLMRKVLLDRMKAKKAQFTALISDTCNVRSIANPAPLHYYKTIPSGPNWLLGNLLRDYAGVLDVSASSRDQYSWFSKDKGGWFTTTFADDANPDLFPRANFITWEMFLGRVGNDTSKYFQDRKADATRNSAGWNPQTLMQIKEQKDMRPQAFTKELKIVR